MGDYQPVAMEDLVACVEGPEYTCDWFTCGLCGLRTSTIENYVSHMILQEHCVLHLCPSGAVRDLLLPRFSKKRRRRKSLGDEETREEVEDVKHLKESKEDRGKGERGVEEETKVEVQAEEVEMGDVRRWKCQVCALTFSRQAAILNHFKLQHRVKGVPGGCGDDADAQVPKVKEEEAAAVPVRHIIAVETKPNVGSLPEVETHADKVWKELGCHLCGQIFKTGKILRAHISVVHSEGRPFQCDYQGCSYTFKSKGSLKRHQRRHTGERPFACQKCGRQFRESGSLTRHLQAQVSCVTKSDVQMPLYGRTLPLQPPHADEMPSLPPDIKFSLKQEVLSAEEQVQNNLLLPLSLPHSGGPLDESKAVLRSQLASGMAGNHLVKVESGGHSAAQPLPVCKVEPPPPPLSTCPSPPPHRALENTVLPSNTGEGEEEEDIKPPNFLPDVFRNSFTCPICLKSFSRRASLSLHIKQHLDELGDRCSECQRRFTTRQALGRHLSSHSSLRQFECRVCGKTFKLLSHARTHLLAHSNAKSVSCRYCSNLYKTKSARNMHERTHTTAPAFHCVECQRTFTTKASLVRHLRTHTGEAPFSCRHCGRSFKEHGTLSRHLHHKVPCAQQARMDRELGNVGIHLLPSSGLGSIKDEGSVSKSDDEPYSDPEQDSEGDNSLLREREEGCDGEWAGQCKRDKEEEDSTPPRFLLLGKEIPAPHSGFFYPSGRVSPGIESTPDARNLTLCDLRQ